MNELRHASLEKEALAIVDAVKKWAHPQTGRRFKIVTDQSEADKAGMSWLISPIQYICIYFHEKKWFCTCFEEILQGSAWDINAH